jgi:hypothetical protein
MKLEPIRRCRDASYPTRDAVDANPEVLRQMPLRWRACPLVLAFAGAFAGVAGCRSSAPNPVVVTQPGPGTATAQPEPAKATEPPKEPKPSEPSPIVGDMPPPRLPPTPPNPMPAQLPGKMPAQPLPPTPPATMPDLGGAVLLHEEQARKIIIDEAGKAGLALKVDGATTIPVPIKGGRKPARSVDVTLDLRADTSKADIIFLSTDADVSAWERTRPGTAAIVAGEPALVTAAIERECKRQTGRDTEVFVTPATVKTMEDAEKDLRQQVRDYITWLKAQGVI